MGEGFGWDRANPHPNPNPSLGRPYSCASTVCSAAHLLRGKGRVRVRFRGRGGGRVGLGSTVCSAAHLVRGKGRVRVRFRGRGRCGGRVWLESSMQRGSRVVDGGTAHLVGVKVRVRARVRARIA